MTPNQRMIRAFQIFNEYSDERQDIHARHDEIYAGPDPANVSAEHLAELDELDWLPCEYNCFRRFT
jgi:predicted component of type VI protein secretion system